MFCGIMVHEIEAIWEYIIIILSKVYLKCTY